jgi:2-oxo-4-hydroxy-4-carboxy-5-ureidoimidazoline decarboxylase
MTLEELNGLSTAGFVAALGAIYEHSPWVAKAVAGFRPFATVAALRRAMESAVDTALPEQKIALVVGHPDLGGKLARAGKLEAASASEQAGLGLDRLSDEEFEAFDGMNTAYRTKFGFPFVIAVKRHTRASILAAFAERLGHTPAVELNAALAEVHAIARFRLDVLLGPAG